MRKRCINFKACGNYTTKGSYCPSCKRAKDRAYKDPAYVANRAAVLAAADGVCQCPGCGVCDGNCKRPATTADHIVPLRQGGDHTTLRAMCLNCNSSRRDR